MALSKLHGCISMTFSIFHRVSVTLSISKHSKFIVISVVKRFGLLFFLIILASSCGYIIFPDDFVVSVQINQSEPLSDIYSSSVIDTLVIQEDLYPNDSISKF